MKRTDSNTSIGFPADIQNESTQPIKPQKISAKDSTGGEESVEDICCLLLFCQLHRKICVSRLKAKGLWFPTIALRFNDSWTLTAIALLKMIIDVKEVDYEVSDPQLIHVFRIQLLQICNFVTRMTFFFEIMNKKSIQTNCCQNGDKYVWIGVEEVLRRKFDNFWGPEVKLFVRYMIANEDTDRMNRIDEYDSSDALKDFCNLLSTEENKTKEQMLIRSACFAEKDILKLYETFVIHCFPTQFMTFSSFKMFAKKIGLKISETNFEPTFRAFDLKNKTYLTFNELLLGLAAIDQATQHGGPAGILRCNYLFRYYDSDSDGYLNVPDICRMIVDIKSQSTQNSLYTITYANNQSSVENLAKQMVRLHGSNGRISKTQFTTAVASLKVRGTSVLFRAPGQTIKHLSMSFVSNENKTNYSSVSLVRFNKYENICENCRKRSYKMSSVVYYMTKSGEVLDFKDFRNDWPTSIETITDFSDQEVFAFASDIINRIIKIYLMRFKGPRGFADPVVNNWFYETKEELINNLLTLCQKSKKMFEKEDRVLRIGSPCYVFGDIHGNLKDLMIFSNNFWRSAPLLNQTNYLFLGDYVDRGDFGVECVAYLCALKLMAPKKFWLCRGNHEVRSMQVMFTFQEECFHNYSEGVWNAFNEVFDRLPVSALIDEKIFCSHGGIPTSTNSVEVLRTVPTILPLPESQSPPVWEVLWNDPMSAEEFESLSHFDRTEIRKTKGFARNIKRGTAFYYSEQAVKQFIEHNKLQFIIRGHECVPNGYRFLMNGTVITIFSTSLYCNLRNEASVLFVNQSKIRVIRVQTFQ